MTIVNKNECHPPAGSGNNACKPRTRPADADAFSSCLRQTIEHCAQGEDPRGHRVLRDGKREGQGHGQGKASGSGDQEHCGEKKKQKEKQCRSPRREQPDTSPAPKSASKQVKDKPESFADFVKGVMLENGKEVQKRTGVLGNTTLEDPGTGDGKKLSMEEYATQFGENFVDAVVDYRMKEFYGQLDREDSQKNKPSANIDKVPNKTSESTTPVSEAPRTPVPAYLAVKEPGIATKTGIDALDRWDAQFAAASRSTGLPANYLKAVAWAQSRGDADASSNNPDGKHVDLGVMQISDYTYGDVLRNQSRAPRDLRAADPADNIMMAAWELRDKFGRQGKNSDYARTSAAYRGVEDGRDLNYGNAVLDFWLAINQGKKPEDSGPW
jgi:hypothetical protein